MMSKIDLISSISNNNLKVTETELPSNDHRELEEYFKKNKHFVSDQDRIFLERYVIAGLPVS